MLKLLISLFLLRNALPTVSFKVVFMLPLIDFQDSVKVGIVYLDAMIFHPGDDKFVAPLADIAEAMQVSPQADDEAMPDAVLQFIHGRLGQIVVILRILALEVRDSNIDGDKMFHGLLGHGLRRGRNGIYFENATLGAELLRHERLLAVILVDIPLRKIWFEV